MVIARDLLGGQRKKAEQPCRSTSTVTDGIATITINRPERLNAMDAEHYKGLSQAWMRVRDDAAIRVAIVTGAGEKSFSRRRRHQELPHRARRPRRDVADAAGSAAQPRARSLEAGDRGGQRLLPRRRHDAAARHRHPRRRRARDLQPRGGQARHHRRQRRHAARPRQLPYAIGMEMLLTGDSIDAQTALRWGLINKVVPAEKLMDTARDYARRRSPRTRRSPCRPRRSWRCARARWTAPPACASSR